MVLFCNSPRENNPPQYWGTGWSKGAELHHSTWSWHQCYCKSYSSSNPALISSPKNFQWDFFHLQKDLLQHLEYLHGPDLAFKRLWLPLCSRLRDSNYKHKASHLHLQKQPCRGKKNGRGHTLKNLRNRWCLRDGTQQRSVLPRSSN